MDYKAVEKKWKKKYWDTISSLKFDENDKDRKLYVTTMFPYPSGAKLHLGHWFNFGLTDCWAKFKKMQGYNVFQPIGFDAFGLPAENYAVKTGIHPRITTYENINAMREQLINMEGMFAWDNEIITCEPEYYKWTQWVFLTLYKMGLAYKKEAPANWCPSCKTVLAREQVKKGKCERCGSDVYTKKMSQWFLKITDYAEELLSFEDLNWPEITKNLQRAWIGKSEGAIIDFLAESGEKLKVFTTRPETVFGVTFIVMAPEHRLVDKIVIPECKKTVEDYIKKAGYFTEIERQATTHEKTGVFTGSYVINPVNGNKVPIWISDYVLESYGTGIVMAVPAHDQRDYEFAKKYGIEVKEVISGGNMLEKAYTGDGVMINSGIFDGMKSNEARSAVISYIKENGYGEKKISYRLRDWLISRQRYWGAPIPIIYCDDCGIVPVPEKDLPVELPMNVDFTPTGESPLAKCKEFIETRCPCCGKKARREVDTMDTFMCSSWYQFRYPDPHNEEKAFNPDTINKMLPVDMYVGGVEHSCMHLLYARFITKALRDAGYTKINEPFKGLIHQGLILGPDGQKMSKSKGNTISPDEYIEKYGSDIFRTYLMFGFNYEEGGPWSENGIVPISKYYNRIDAYFNKYLSIVEFSDLYGKEEEELEKVLNSTIDKVTHDFEVFKFNTAIAKMMELSNAINKYIDTERNSKILKYAIEVMTKLIAPSAPNIAEEYWEKQGHNESIFLSKWPQADKTKMESTKIKIPVQINSKNVTIMEINKSNTKDEVEALAKKYIDAKLDGKTIRKVIYVPEKIINFVVKK